MNDSIPYQKLVLLLLGLLPVSATAQQIAATATPDGTDVAYSPASQTLTFDLREYFSTSGFSGGTLVQFDGNAGVFHMEMLDNATPNTVQNFLFYVNEGRFDDTIIHRAEIYQDEDTLAFVPFVIQGGGWRKAVGGSALIEPIETEDPVANEFNPDYSNLRATVAMAKAGGDPDSATSQWFINLSDNAGPPPSLDSQNGGFTVFATVIGRGMEIADTVVDLPKASDGGTLTSVPLINYESANPIAVENFVAFDTVRVVDPLPSANAPGFFAFETEAAGPVSASVNGPTLSVTVFPGANGAGTVRVRAFETGFADTANAPEITFRVYAGAGLSAATDLGDSWKYSTWLGLYYDTGTNWIHHPTLEWIYVADQTLDGGSLLYVSGFGWVWTRRDLFPYLWSFGADGGNGAWLTYDTGSNNPRWFYDWSISDWVGVE